MLTKCQLRNPAHRLRISFAHNETCQVYVTDFTITFGVQHDVPRAAGNALASIRALDPAINEPTKWKTKGELVRLGGYLQSIFFLSHLLPVTYLLLISSSNSTASSSYRIFYL